MKYCGVSTGDKPKHCVKDYSQDPPACHWFDTKDEADAFVRRFTSPLGRVLGAGSPA
jgi:hypothetical protein